MPTHRHAHTHTHASCNTAGVAWHDGNAMASMCFTWKPWNDFILPFLEFMAPLWHRISSNLQMKSFRASKPRELGTG